MPDPLPAISRLRTRISEVAWCNPAKSYCFEDAKLKIPPETDEKAVSWLDQLLDGGFRLPLQDGQNPQALGILITGSPGTGKSTLALELAYRWSQEQFGGHKLQILYATLEASPHELINNTESYGWKSRLQALASIERIEDCQQGRVNVISFEKLGGALFRKDPSTPGEKTRLDSEEPSVLDTFYKEIAEWAERWRNAGRGQNIPAVDAGSSDGDAVRPGDRASPPRPPDVLIVDSLNSIPQAKNRTRLFQQYSRLLQVSPRVIIFILDSAPASQRAEFWEFASDVVVRLDRQYDTSGYMGYMIRNIEIVKARFQWHAWGRHQLKIYKASALGSIPEAAVPAESAAERMRAHPYRIEGGIFIFPSIHFVLSVYKHVTASREQQFTQRTTVIPNFERLLGNGYPIGRCTALIGERGGHKSHLGYAELLNRLLSSAHEKALVVSLRDDEGVTRGTMTKILAQRRSHHTLESFEREGRLEIIYFPPGYITPEEFFHRVLLSINRLKNCREDRLTEPHVTLLFNSLDQLSARFPLCAKEPIFIPGIIQLLASEGVSSFFVAAREEGRAGYYGLDSMAELILEFEHRSFKWSEVVKHMQAIEKLSSVVCPEGLEQATKRAVVLSVGRYAGGQAAGAEGILELLDPISVMGKAVPDGLGLSDTYPEHDLIIIPRDETKSGEFGKPYTPLLHTWGQHQS